MKTRHHAYRYLVILAILVAVSFLAYTIRSVDQKIDTMETRLVAVETTIETMKTSVESFKTLTTKNFDEAMNEIAEQERLIVSLERLFYNGQ